MKSDKAEIKESILSEIRKNYNNQQNFFSRLITFSFYFKYILVSYQTLYFSDFDLCIIFIKEKSSYIFFNNNIYYYIYDFI